MGRRPLGEAQERLVLDAALVDVERRVAANAAERWARPRPASNRVYAAGVQETLSEAAVMMASGSWSEAKPRHFVALWAMCHERVYRATALGELAGIGWRASVKAAADMHRDEFGGDGDEMAGFVRWCWLREEGKDRWCRERGFERRTRLTWRAQFGGTALADYRVELARKGLR